MQMTANKMIISDLLRDRKEDKKDVIGGRNDDDSFMLLMKFFISKENFPKDRRGWHKNHLEDAEHNREIYQYLCWLDAHYFDVINSFWTIFSWVMHIQYPYIYPIARAGNVKIYKNDYKDYMSFPRQYCNDEELHSRVKSLKEYEEIILLAGKCHCVANFMPCPGEQFNSLKGLHPQTKDFLPLVVDLIESCCVHNNCTEYTTKGKKIIIKRETLKEWKKWLIDNRDTYCLEDYYDIVNDDSDPEQKHIKGISFFEGQSLKNPLPKREREIRMCLNEMVARIEKRAYKLYNRYVTNAGESSEKCNT